MKCKYYKYLNGILILVLTMLCASANAFAYTNAVLTDDVAVSTEDESSDCTGGLDISFTTENGTPVSGVVATITGDSYSQTYTSNSNGMIELSGLAPGYYTVTPVTVPDGYTCGYSLKRNVVSLYSVPMDFTLEKEIVATGIDITVTDMKYATGISGVQLKISNNAGYSQIVTTDANGNASVSGIDEGTYTVEQISAPEGYTINESTKTQSVETTYAERATVSIGDQPKGALVITYEAGDEEDSAEGATFKITNASGIVQNQTTNSNGKIELANIDSGEYTVAHMRDGQSVEEQRVNVGAGSQTPIYFSGKTMTYLDETLANTSDDDSVSHTLLICISLGMATVAALVILVIIPAYKTFFGKRKNEDVDDEEDASEWDDDYKRFRRESPRIHSASTRNSWDESRSLIKKT